MRNGHVAMRGQVLLTKSSNLIWEGRKREEERDQTEERGKVWDFRERNSTFSLKFPTIGPSVSGEARSKVAPHGTNYAWVPDLGSFDELREGRGVSPT